MTETDMTIRQMVEAFAKIWEREQGYKPAPFQKAIAMQRLGRGQTIRQIIDALVAQRV
jgi:hypothetical protein